MEKKAKRGRPPQDPEGRMVLVGVYMPQRQADALATIAARNGMSLSAFLRKKLGRLAGSLSDFAK